MKLITQILHPHKAALGDHYQSYHHHCQRVYTYAHTLMLQRESKKLAIVAAFHDLGIWTQQTMDYLNPSVALMKSYIESKQLTLLPDELAYIIEHHHRIRKIKDHLEAEAFRKADLIDFTAGWIRYNLPESIIRDTEKKWPRANFTSLVLKKVSRHAIRHPMKPLPMLKW